MKPAVLELGIQRMLLALEASAHELAHVEAAARLAAQAEAELSGLLVEDEALRRLAELPVARVHGRHAPAGHAIDAPGMERALRAFSERARAAIERSAERAGVRWSFQVVRGQLHTQVVAAAAPADLVVVRGGEEAPAVAIAAPCSVLVLGSADRPGTPAMVVYGSSRAADRALVAAARLASPRGGDPRLTVLVTPGERAAMAARREQAGIVLRQLGREAQFKQLSSAEPVDLLGLAAQRGAMLVLDAEEVASPEVRALLERATFPVLLVR